MAELTKEIITALQPKAERYDVTDDETKGLSLRIAPDGTKTWAYRYRMGGRGCRQSRVTIGPWPAHSLDAARQKARALRVEVDNGGDPSLKKKRDREIGTVSDLLDQVDADHWGTLKSTTASTYRGLAKNHLKPFLGKLRVDQLSMADVARFHKSLSGSPRVANQALAVLSKSMNLAEVWGLRPLGTNPCQHQQRSHENKRERYLSTDELARVGAVLNAGKAEWTEGKKLKSETLSALQVGAIRILLLSGMRRGEVLGLKRSAIKADRIVLSEHKTDKKGSKSVFLHPALAVVLDDLKKCQILGNPLVLPGWSKKGGIGSSLDHAWNAVRLAAGIPDVRMHDLRHTYASIAAGLGLSLPQIGALLGHSSQATTQRYAHLAPSTLLDSVSEIGEQIRGKLG
jgi:integrase